MKHLTALAALLVAALALVGARPAGAAACSTEQLTDTTAPVSNTEPSLSDDGTRLAWLSNGQWGGFGDNEDGNTEAWVYDLGSDDPIEEDAVQASNSSAGNASQVAISGNGQFVVFRHNGDPGNGNADGNAEIWRFNVASPALTQLTTTTGGSNTGPSVDDSGTRIAFTSNRNLSSLNADQNNEVFLVDTAGSGVLALTTTTGGQSLSRTSIDGAGTHVTYSSDANLTTENAGFDDQVFVTTVLGATDQLTNLTDSPHAPEPVIDDAGGQIVFPADDDSVTGNPDGNSEIYAVTPGGSTITSLTNSTGGANGNQRPVIADTGRVVFTSDADLDGTNADGNREVVVLDRSGHAGTFFTTHTTGGLNLIPSVDADGTRIAFESNRDLTGANPDGNLEIFLSTCGAVLPTYTDVPAGNFFYDAIQWMAEAEVANGFPNGTFKPVDLVKRQQMANFLYNLAGRPAFTPPVTPTFVDVPASNPFFIQIEWMSAAGIANGFPGGLFKPNDPVKRQQMANFLYNLAGQPDFTPPVAPTYSDVPTSNPFYAQIEWMGAEAIANGFPGGLFKPGDPVKRQQMANFLLNLANGPGVELL